MWLGFLCCRNVNICSSLKSLVGFLTDLSSVTHCTFSHQLPVEEKISPHYDATSSSFNVGSLCSGWCMVLILYNTLCCIKLKHRVLHISCSACMCFWKLHTRLLMNFFQWFLFHNCSAHQFERTVLGWKFYSTFHHLWMMDLSVILFHNLILLKTNQPP